MFKILYERIKQGYKTIPFPKQEPNLPDRFRGLLNIDYSKCMLNCNTCIEVCPTNAITRNNEKLNIDLGKCLFCTDCMNACPNKAIEFSKQYSLSTRKKSDLHFNGETVFDKMYALDKTMLKIFGRSLRLRQVSAGGCNGCELDVNVLNTIVFDLSRFGIQFVASPRHADGLLITGPVTQHMQLALKKAYDAIPSTKIVISVGACAISGGPYIDHPEVNNGADALVPVDLYIPGCPPHPITILDGLLQLLARRYLSNDKK